MKKLYAHQQRIVDEDPKWTGFFLGTGSGKTRTALHLARGSTLVICPKTQKEDGNWEREWDSMVRAGTAHPGAHVTTISKETFRRDWQTLQRYNTVIVDEAHTCLGVTPNTRQRKKVIIPKASQLYEALDSYIAYNKPERLYLVTATVMRSPMTVWAAASILGRKWDFYGFRQAFYFKLPMPGREVWAPKQDSGTKDRLAKAVRSLGYVGRLEDFFDVPDQTHKVEYVELTAKQRQRIKDMRLEYPEPIVRIGKIHQIENGVLAGDEFNAPESFDNAKLDKVLDYSWEFPKMVVFAKYTAQIESMREALEKTGKKVFVLDGSTKDRGAVLAEANASDEYVFIAQAQVSAGWELPDCPVMVFASKTYSFVDYDQAVGRIQRANNIKKNLYIHLVTRGGVDEAAHEAVEGKKDFNERIYTNL
jgi:superfamily II DNA or RNA helicase